jgi:phage-related protein
MATEQAAQPLKPVEWIGSSRHDLRALPDEVQGEAGWQLFRVQQGREPEDFRPMPGVGGGAYEIRIHTQTEHRLLYVAKFAEAVYVLHVFAKRTRKTSRRDVEIGKRRYAQVLAQRKG